MKKKTDIISKKASRSQPGETDDLPQVKNKNGNETDYDELVHMVNETEPKDIAKHDPDEAIHLEQNDVPTPGNEMDVDDIVHKRDMHEDDI